MKSPTMLSLMIVFTTGMLHAQYIQNRFILKGKLSGQKDGQVYLSYISDNKQIKDSSYIIENKFVFRGNISEPGRAFLTLKEEKYDERHSVGFFIESSIIKVKVQVSDFSKVKISGSITQDESNELDASKKTL